ncbi:uncharacterized protein LOC129584888 [Paramacrobiotus metropolitanus]|uniref:uncharacterized protein LOC129584888 n=1 Tax=Paramacrobiotus metropolitanus TaxID=2943436 RepID=UPI002445F73D|nr:uncharacterized protein LOC129584888 [Paramacrobiotus metropolitanus]
MHNHSGGEGNSSQQKEAGDQPESEATTKIPSLTTPQSLTYSTGRSTEPAPPTWQNLLEDISKCSFQDPVVKRTDEDCASVPSVRVSDEVNVAQVQVQLQVAARILLSLVDTAGQKHETFKNSLARLKEELEDLT